MVADLILPRSANGHGARSDAYAMLLESRIAELEVRLQEQGWMRLDAEAGKEFSRDSLDALTDLARVSYLKNPLINRAVEVGALYVWGQDLTVSADDQATQAACDLFWQTNRSILTGQQASRALEVELQVTGNVFLALFPDPAAKTVRVRPVPIEEVRDIITNPMDRYEPLFYYRCWNERRVEDGTMVKQEALYPDWRYRPASRSVAIQREGRDIPIRWETPLLHVKVGAFPHWRWGVSEVYAALDWARAYKDVLEDDATRSRALRRFAWSLTTSGGAQGVAAGKAKLGTTFGVGAGETNPPPVSGSTWIQGQGVDMKPISLAGTMLDPDHSRPIRLMAAAALGLPETFFGDADVGNHATAKTLDRPTELRFNERRQMWKDVLTDLLRWVVGDPDADIDLSWPDLLEQDTTARVQAIAQAMTLNGQAPAGTIPDETGSRMMLVALGVEDVDGEVQKATAEREERQAKADQIAQQTQQQGPGDEEDDGEREQFVAALRSVREALDGR